MENYNVNYSVHLPSYSIGPIATTKCRMSRASSAKRLLSLGGETAMEKAKPRCLKA